jgi:hypothetical protein
MNIRFRRATKKNLSGNNSQWLLSSMNRNIKNLSGKKSAEK